ncbi:hypothetical protein COM45_08000 [Corynebacterium accolens]|uniref:Heparinase II/III-like C-terminal domain-containing protein n=1 Tax=Corynebacterium accolens TaxID=38284 RepID=A0A2A4AJU3_9CORY|nr:hypothetical protein COM45_08000 [Corynebacterium accolens]
MRIQDLPREIQDFVPKFKPESSAEHTRQFLAKGVVNLDHDILESLDEKFWASERQRSEGRKAHAWFFLREWNSAASTLNEEERLNTVKKFASLFPLWLESRDLSSSMAYHDETTAQRVINTAVFCTLFAPEIEFVGFPSLTTNLNNDIKLLKSSEFYAGKNNHGMFQDIALLVAHALGFADVEAKNTGVKRLLAYFDSCFTRDGIHAENNPTYHVMVSNYVRLVAKYLEGTGENANLRQLDELLQKADKYAAFCVMPNLSFPPISDTNLRTLNVGNARRVFGDGYFVGALTRGSEGVVHESKSMVAEESGYLIARSGWQESDSVLFFSAAYNHDYHKHSDELSVYLFANGHPLLAEAGPNGYQYDDPYTEYAFSSAAHNSLMVDGVGLPRVDKKANLTYMDDLSTEDKIIARGTTQRFEGVNWTRTVETDRESSSGHYRFVDKIDSSERHSYKFIWHLGDSVVPVVRGSIVECFSIDHKEKIGELSCLSGKAKTVEVIKGRRHPQIQGFSFPRMGKKSETYAVEYTFDAADLEVEWTMRTRDYLIKPRGISPWNEEWETFYGEKPVRYLLENAERASDGLLVVFSAVNPVGDFTYNYRASLTDYSGAVMYILDDFGDQGAYYLAGNREQAEFRSVQGALRSVLQRLDVKPSSVTTLGSSKGGTAALIHGVALGARRVYAGGPQFRVGSFLKTPHPNILTYMAGSCSSESVRWADEIVRRSLMSGARQTELVVVVGENDGHYRKHAVPLVDQARALGYKASLFLLPGTTHAELGAAFRQFVSSFAKMTITDTEIVLPNASSYNTEKQEYGTVVHLPVGYKAIAQLQIDGKPFGPTKKVINGAVRWMVPQSGIVRARVYVETPTDGKRLAFGTNPIRVEVN